MRTIIFLLLSSNLWACKPNEIAWEGRCAADPKPVDTVAVPEVQPSSEKPSRHPEPAWQRGEVHADTPPSCAATNACSDQVAIEATKEGKKAAGLKP
jgi:hypothetical protein